MLLDQSPSLSLLPRPKVKICGLRDPDQARLAADCGADGIGLMFHDASPRHLSIAEAKQLSEAIAGRTTRVGVFVNPDRAMVEAVLASVPLDMLQFHGNESDSDCQRWGLPWIKVVRVQGAVEVEQLRQRWPNAAAFLLDACSTSAFGGTGERFDWSLFPKQSDIPLMLAGGLRPDNIAQAIATVKPWAVDVSSGVESAKGVKDSALIRAFLQEVNRVRQC